MSPLRTAACVAALVVAGCSGDDGAPSTTLPSDLSPVQVVEELLDAIVDGRFEDTPPLTVADHAALLALAEGADAADVLDALEDEGRAVTANFWSGFAQTMEPGLETDDFDVVAGDPTHHGPLEFVTVTVSGGGRDPQYFVVRGDAGWRLDLMATFGPVLAERLIPPIESLLESANADAGVVLSHLRQVEPSLNYAFERPDLPADSHQALLALVERITRTG